MGEDFQGKVVVVTGGSRGIGEATARAFAAEGARVAVLSRKLEALQEVTTAIQDAGGEAMAVQAHCGKAEEIVQAVDTVVDVWGGLDILVNNAATNPHFGPILDCPEGMWDKIFQVNVKGFFLAIQAAAPHLERRDGVIVNVSSIAGIKAAPMMGIYSVSKAAVIHMTKALARELGGRGVRVNCVAPGLIRTHFSRAIWDNEALMDEVMKSHAVDRIGEPEEVAKAILYMAGEGASYVTGSVLVLDGGEILF